MKNPFTTTMTNNSSSPSSSYSTSHFHKNDKKAPPSFPSQNIYPPTPTMTPHSRTHLVNMTNDPRVRYFKTQLCRKFRLGICSLGSNCSFAHSVHELRRAHFVNNNNKSNDLDRTCQESRLCRMFYQGQQCSYGATCRFLHVRPGGRDVTTVEVVNNGGNGKRKCDYDDDGVFDGEVNLKRDFMKTQFCIKWEIKGVCNYGDTCRFAHGQQELGKLDGNSTAECRPTSATTTASNVSTGALLKKLKRPCALNHKFNRNDLHRISRIYADWI